MHIQGHAPNQLVALRVAIHNHISRLAVARGMVRKLKHLASIVMGIVAEIEFSCVIVATQTILVLIIGVEFLPKIVIKIAMCDEVLGNQR